MSKALNKSIIFIESNTSGSGMLALQKAQQMGYIPLLVTHKPDRYRGLEELHVATIACDTNSLNTIHTHLEEQSAFFQFSGITTTSDFYVQAVAELARHYALLSNSAHAIQICRDKSLTRIHLQAAGIAQPLFHTVELLEDVRDALRCTGLPCVVKPVDDSSSNNVKLCINEEEACKQVKHILSIERNVRGQETAQRALIEQYIDAPEYSVEMFSVNGKTTCIGITEKRLTGFPFFVEERHIFPAPIPPEVKEEIVRTVQKTLETVGIHYGPTHTEVKWINDSCYIIEINPRLAGGMIPELIQQSTGLDLLEMQLCLATQQPISLEFEYCAVAGIQFLMSKKEGTFKNISGIPEVLQLEGVKKVASMVNFGQAIRPTQNAYDRLGYVIAATESHENTRAILDQVLQIARIELLEDCI